MCTVAHMYEYIDTHVYTYTHKWMNVKKKSLKKKSSMSSSVTESSKPAYKNRKETRALAPSIHPPLLLPPPPSSSGKGRTGQQAYGKPPLSPSVNTGNSVGGAGSLRGQPQKSPRESALNTNAQSQPQTHRPGAVSYVSGPRTCDGR